jgi:hypothetical protein
LVFCTMKNLATLVGACKVKKVLMNEWTLMDVIKKSVHFLTAHFTSKRVKLSANFYLRAFVIPAHIHMIQYYFSKTTCFETKLKMTYILGIKIFINFAKSNFGDLNNSIHI